jgi:SAM-dependent methyltransferase
VTDALPSPGSSAYWERRYRKGRNSGPGSYSRLARFKADTVNRLVAEDDIFSVIEFGCGDGNQLSLMQYKRYCGIDVSPTAIANCRRIFAADPTKRFLLPGELAQNERFDCSISLDVIFHLLEDDVFEHYMEDLFRFATRRVIVYSSDCDDRTFEMRHGVLPAPHVRHRPFTRWIERNAPHWRALQVIANDYPFDVSDQNNTSFADFHVYGPA